MPEGTTGPGNAHEPAPPGFRTPQQQARREAEDKVLDNGIPMGSAGIRMIDRQNAEDAAANAPINGGFHMDPAELKASKPTGPTSPKSCKPCPRNPRS